jgi:lysozyme family protein
MEKNFDKCLEMLLVHEGGWSKHSKDPGGSTMKGVTKKVYEEYLGRECTDDELLTIKDEESFPLLWNVKSSIVHLILLILLEKVG